MRVCPRTRCSLFIYYIFPLNAAGVDALCTYISIEDATLVSSTTTQTLTARPLDSPLSLNVLLRFVKCSSTFYYLSSKKKHRNACVYNESHLFREKISRRRRRDVTSSPARRATRIRMCGFSTESKLNAIWGIQFAPAWRH